MRIQFMLAALLCAMPVVALSQAPASSDVAARIVAHYAAVNAESQAYLTRLTAIDTTGFPDQDLLSHQLMERGLRQRIEDFGLKTYEMPVNQAHGTHTDLSDLPNAVPLDEMLCAGALPLDLLDARTNAWIASQQAATRGE